MNRSSFRLPPVPTLLALLLLPLGLLAADPSGTWQWSLQGPNGNSLDTTATFEWDGSRLTGTLQNRAGEAKISDAACADDQISFTVVRKIRRHKFTTKYTGKLQDDTIQGSIETSGRDGQTHQVVWTAKRKP